MKKEHIEAQSEELVEVLSDLLGRPLTHDEKWSAISHVILQNEFDDKISGK